MKINCLVFLGITKIGFLKKYRIHYVLKIKTS